MECEADPFAPLECENHNVVPGQERESQVPPSSTPQSLAQKERPWDRLHEDATLASSRRHFLHFDPEAPKDSLDLHLKATYDHHQDFLWNKNQTLFQKETFTEDHGRTLKNRAKEKPPERGGIENVQLRVSIDPRKSSIYSIKGPIESHHGATTNRGYSRKQDGGFYAI
ncbi:hypothetical protein GN956_G26184 [Arapaima gigas]